ncbi:hypothetical protein ABVF61_30665 [Roseibium sp. HPY-6]|uniref:hypothetical protein n=1 Tax=Roseibium sp. HPY-6 TaxID=3229852 RepID=UPI00338F051C
MTDICKIRAEPQPKMSKDSDHGMVGATRPSHAGRRVDIQDFMITEPGAASFGKVLEITNKVYLAADDLKASKGRLAGVANVGGWWLEFSSNEEEPETLTLKSKKPVTGPHHRRRNYDPGLGKGGCDQGTRSMREMPHRFVGRPPGLEMR